MKISPIVPSRNSIFPQWEHTPRLQVTGLDYSNSHISHFFVMITSSDFRGQCHLACIAILGWLVSMENFVHIDPVVWLINTHTQIHAHAYTSYTCMHTNPHAYTYTHIHTHKYLHTYKHSYIHTYIHLFSPR